MSDPLQNAHNQGQADAADGKDRSEPHIEVPSLINIMLGGSADEARESKEENDAYNAGYDNAKGSGCFLTTACVEHAGLPDNCHELMTLRRFRDTHLLANPSTRSLVDEYYRRAPSLVLRISLSPSAKVEFADIFKRIRRIVDMIDNGQSEDAVKCYQDMFNEVSAKHGQ